MDHTKIHPCYLDPSHSFENANYYPEKATWGGQPSTNEYVISSLLMCGFEYMNLFASFPGDCSAGEEAAVVPGAAAGHD